jgi:hypothetical protein
MRRYLGAQGGAMRRQRIKAQAAMQPKTPSETKQDQ